MSIIEIIGLIAGFGTTFAALHKIREPCVSRVIYAGQKAMNAIVHTHHRAFGGDKTGGKTNNHFPSIVGVLEEAIFYPA